MAVDERARHRLYLRLEELLGPEETRTLMELFPSVPWPDIATKQDLVLLRSDVDGLRNELTAEIGGLRKEITGLESRTDLKLEALEHRLIAGFRAEFVRQTRTMVFGQAGTVIAVAGLAFAAARLT